MRKVVVTGIGLVTPLGCDLEKFWKRIVSGYSGIRRIQQFDVAPYPSKIGGEVIEFDVNEFIDKKSQRRMDPYCHFAIAAAKLAVADSGLDMSKIDSCRGGVIVGSGVGGLQAMQASHAVLITKGPSRCSPFMIPQMICDIAAGHIAIEYNLKGPNYAVV